MCLPGVSGSHLVYRVSIFINLPIKFVFNSLKQSLDLNEFAVLTSLDRNQCRLLTLLHENDLRFIVCYVLSVEVDFPFQLNECHYSGDSHPKEAKQVRNIEPLVENPVLGPVFAVRHQAPFSLFGFINPIQDSPEAMTQVAPFG